MAEGNPDFYGETLDRLLRSGVLDREMRILVLCGGKTDRTVLLQRGFTDVTITNVDPRPRPKAFAPYQWSYQDAEHLTYEDESFDFCIVHSGLHHCHSPHRALLEMYRVARHGLLLFEPYDNLLTRARAAVRTGAGVRARLRLLQRRPLRRGCQHRDPQLRLPVDRAGDRQDDQLLRPHRPARHPVLPRDAHPVGAAAGPPPPRALLRGPVGAAGAAPARALFPAAEQHFAALVRKPDLPQALHPWLRQRDGAIELNLDWLGARYGPPAGRQRAASPERSPARAPGVG